MILTNAKCNSYKQSAVKIFNFYNINLETNTNVENMRQWYLLFKILLLQLLLLLLLLCVCIKSNKRFEDGTPSKNAQMSNYVNSIWLLCKIRFLWRTFIMKYFYKCQTYNKRERENENSFFKPLIFVINWQIWEIRFGVVKYLIDSHLTDPFDCNDGKREVLSGPSDSNLIFISGRLKTNGHSAFCRKKL
jgi:hypothetical protein